jgi:two-component system OmpR family response regulator
MKRILIIDDEEDLCAIIKIFLVKRNYEVDIAHSLREGYRKMRLHQPDILLLDNNLPDGKGWLAATDIRKKYPNLAITLISAYQDTGALSGSNVQGFNILEKPVSLRSIEQYI